MSNARFDGLYVGESFPTTLTVENKGNAFSPGTKAHIYISKDSTINFQDELIKTFDIYGLGIDQKREEDFEFFLPAHDDTFWTYDGDYYLGVVVDGNNLIPETDNTNNSKSYKIDVTRTDKPVVRVEDSSDGFTFKVNQNVPSLKVNYHLKTKEDYLAESLPAYDKETDRFYTDIDSYFDLEQGTYHNLSEKENEETVSQQENTETVTQEEKPEIVNDYYDVAENKYQLEDGSYYDFIQGKYVDADGNSSDLAYKITSEFTNKYDSYAQGYYDADYTTETYIVPLDLINDSYYLPDSKLYSFAYGYYSLDEQRFYTQEPIENSDYHDTQTNTYTYSNGVVIDPNKNYNPADYYFDINGNDPNSSSQQYYDPDTGYYHLDTETYYDSNSNAYYDSYGGYFDITNKRIYESDGSYLDINNHRIYESNGNYFDINTGYYHYADGSYFDISSGYYDADGNYYEPPVDPDPDLGYDTSYYDPSGGYFDGYSYTTAYTTATGSSVSDYGEYYGTNGSYYSPSGEYYTSSSSYYSFESNDYYIFSGYIDSEARYWTFELLDSYFDPTTRKIYDTVNNTERDITTRGEVYFNEEDGNYYNTSTGNYFEGTYYYRPDGSYYDDSDGYYYDALGGYYDPEQNRYNLASSAYFDTNTNNFYPNSSDNFVYFDAEKNRYQNSDNGSYLDPITHRIINTDGTYFEPDGGYYYQTDGSYVDSKNRTYHIPDVGYVEDIIEVGDYSSPAFQWSYIGEKLDGRYYDFGGGFFEDDTRVEIPNDNYYLPTEDYYNVKKNQFYSKSGFYLNQQQDSLYYHYVDDTRGTEEERIINPIAYALPNIATRGKDYNLSPFAGEKFVSVLGKRTG